MAATWTVKIDVRSAATRWICVTGTRTDGLDVRIYSIDNLNVPATGLGAWLGGIAAQLRAMHDAAIAVGAANAGIVAAGETALADKLNAMEGA